MPHEVPFRFNQALDASGLTSLDSALRSANDAIKDCQRSGKRAERDPAVLLLLRHLGSLAASTGGDELELRNACFETVKDLRRRPLLTTLALDGVAYNAERKKLFHAEARRALSALADALGYERRDFDLRSNQGGIAVSGEVTLHSDEAYIQVSCDCRGGRVLFRRCRNRRDYCGDPNHFAAIDELTNPTQLAARICRELRLATPAITDLLAACREHNTMHAMMEVFGAGRPKLLETFATFDLAYAALTARPDLVFSEPDGENPGCADAFLSDGRLLVIEPADRRP